MSLSHYSNFIKKMDEMEEEKRKKEQKFHNTPLKNKYLCKRFVGLSNDRFLSQHSIENIEEETILPTREKKFIDKKIVDLSSLLEIIEENPFNPYIEYNINLQRLHNIKHELQELNSMIGLSDLKTSIMNQVIYYLQDLHVDSKGDYMHTCIYGSPGTGKTEVARIIGSIYSKLGILKKGTFKKVTRPDLIAGYLGQTAIKTKKLVQECLGGVLFIDEAYSLGNQERRDSFSKECIDTLCELLSFHKDELMVIIAGYENELKDCFFSYNSGLKSRFTWCFDTQEYTSKEMMEIFKRIIRENKWDIEIGEKKLSGWFSRHHKSFTYFGRDMEDLFSKVKIAHSRRVFTIEDPTRKKKIQMEDLEEGFQCFLKYKTDRENSGKDRYKSMYM